MPEAAKNSSSDPRPSTVVVTSENLAEFQAQKLGIETPKPGESKTEEAKAEAKAGTEAGKGDQATADEALEDEKKAEKDPKRQRLNMRFSELTSERKKAEGERDAARAEAKQEREARLALEAKLTQKPEGDAKGDKAKESPPADAKPERAKFKAGAEGDAEYQEALTDWKVEQKFKAREEEETERREQEARQGTLTAWKENQQAVRAVIPDYDAKIAAASSVQLSDQVRDTIIGMKGEAGPRCLYYFAEFPQEAERIGKLTVGDALVELGEIRAKVMSGKKPADKANGEDKGAKADAEVSRAPKPAVPLKSTSAPEDMVDDQGNLKPGFTYKQYKAARRAGKIS